MEKMLKLNEGSKKPFLLFTSAGDHCSVRSWATERRGFDICLCYYGDDASTHYGEYADYYIERKGGKFPNLKYVYDHWPEIFEGRESILVIDDDLTFSQGNIDDLFRLSKEFGLLLSQPSMDRRGKTSHRINKNNPYTVLRFTNFIEVTAPVIDMNLFNKFMSVYDSDLNCKGVDSWLSAMVSELDGKMAVIDAISCVNPYDEVKGGREIDKLYSSSERDEQWARAKKLNGLSDISPKEMGAVYLPFKYKSLGLRISQLLIRVSVQFQKLVDRKIKG